MRNKIDNLILINLLWLIVADAGSQFSLHIMTIIAILGAIGTTFYEVSLIKATKKIVEAHFQPRLYKRIGYNILFSITLVLFSTLTIVL